MSISVNTNLSSLNAQVSQARSGADLSSAVSRLSSGLRISSAKDDAAGLAIGARFTTQIRGITQASRNANDAISLTQTADGALSAIGDDLQRIRELAVQSANASNSATDRASLQNEVSQLQSEIDRVATQTSFNGINLLDGSFTSKAFQVGADAGQTITVNAISNMRSAALGTYGGLSFSGLGPAFGAGVPLAVSVQIGSSAQIALGTVDGDANAIAAAINAGNVAGFSATTNATTVAAATSTANASTSGTAALTVNGTVISLAGTSGGAALGGNRNIAVAAINAQSANTGVVASDTGSGVALIAQDGRNISLSYSAGSFAGSAAADFGISASVVPGITSGSYNFNMVAPSGANGMALIFAETTAPFNSTAFGGAFVPLGTRISSIDVSTVSGANAALASVDRALTTVTSARASLGAVQNRVSSTVANLQSSNANLSAARSRILDADFAQETARLASAQVIQKASLAMVAQANQLPNLVLSLLK